MSTERKKSSTGAKVFLTFVSITGILGLWIVFASKAELEASAASSSAAQPIVAGEIYFPEMPTLVPMIDLNGQVVQSQPVEAQQNLRSVSIPTPMVQNAAPQIRVEQIVVGNASGNTSSSGGSSSSAAPATSTGSSK